MNQSANVWHSRRIKILGVHIFKGISSTLASGAPTFLKNIRTQDGIIEGEEFVSFRRRGTSYGKHFDATRNAREQLLPLFDFLCAQHLIPLHKDSTIKTSLSLFLLAASSKPLQLPTCLHVCISVSQFLLMSSNSRAHIFLSSFLSFMVPSRSFHPAWIFVLLMPHTTTVPGQSRSLLLSVPVPQHARRPAAIVLCSTPPGLPRCATAASLRRKRLLKRGWPLCLKREISDEKARRRRINILRNLALEAADWFGLKMLPPSKQRKWGSCFRDTDVRPTMVRSRDSKRSGVLILKAERPKDIARLRLLKRLEIISLCGGSRFWIITSAAFFFQTGFRLSVFPANDSRFGNKILF